MIVEIFHLYRLIWVYQLEIKLLDFRQVNLLRDLTLSQKHLMISHHGKSGSFFSGAQLLEIGQFCSRYIFFGSVWRLHPLRLLLMRLGSNIIRMVHYMLDAQPIVVAPVQPFLAHNRDTELQRRFLEVCDCWLFSKHTAACLIASLRDDWYHHCLQFFIIIIMVVDHDLSMTNLIIIIVIISYHYQ